MPHRSEILRSPEVMELGKAAFWRKWLGGTESEQSGSRCPPWDWMMRQRRQELRSTSPSKTQQTVSKRRLSNNSSTARILSGCQALGIAGSRAFDSGVKSAWQGSS